MVHHIIFVRVIWRYSTGCLPTRQVIYPPIEKPASTWNPGNSRIFPNAILIFITLQTFQWSSRHVTLTVMPNVPDICIAFILLLFGSFLLDTLGASIFRFGIKLLCLNYIIIMSHAYRDKTTKQISELKCDKNV